MCSAFSPGRPWTRERASNFEPMKILAIETATEACSAALFLEGEILRRYDVQPRRQSELILGMMDALLAEAGIAVTGLDGIAFGCGPGSFTGVRIAAGVAQGAAFGADLPVVPVSTLAALAQRYFRERGGRRLLPAFDARMGEVYWGGYEIGDNGLVEVSIEDELSAPERVTRPDGGGWHGVGSGWRVYGGLLAGCLGDGLQSVAPELLCDAHDVALLGAATLRRSGGVPAEHGLPVYLRDKVAKKPGER